MPVQEPALTEEALRARHRLLGTFTTSFAKSPHNAENRVFNIRKAAAAIDAEELAVRRRVAVGAAHGGPGHRQDRGELDVDRAVLLGGPRRHGRRGDQLAHRDQVLLVREALEGATDQLVARRGTHVGESTDRERAP